MVLVLLLFSETLIKACCWLSYKKTSLVSGNWSHITSFAIKVRAIYSVLIDNYATIACFFEHQLTGPPLSMKIKPKVYLQLFLLPVQSESEYPYTNSSSWPS